MKPTTVDTGAEVRVPLFIDTGDRIKVDIQKGVYVERVRVMSYTILGIQYLGVGVPEHAPAWKWYRQFFGMDIPLFNDEAEAPLMTIYTEGESYFKRAAMVLNIKGGCAMEVVCPKYFQSNSC